VGAFKNQIALFILTTAILMALVILTKFWKPDSTARRSLVNYSLAFFVSAYLFIIIDTVFGIFVVQSDGFNFTLTSQRWFQKYWHPINSFGYRDNEPDINKKTVIVVGDSFVAGHGIRRIKDRFPNVLDSLLGSDWTVAVLAKNDWDSEDEFAALTSHPVLPEIIIISYYINDIESAAEKGGIFRPQLVKEPQILISPLVRRSYVLNWVYWRLIRRTKGDSYRRYLHAAYNDELIWKLHRKELDAFIQFAGIIDAKIFFVIWPDLIDIAYSEELTRKVTQYLASRKAKLLDLTAHFIDDSPDELIVNSLDGHPNENVHRRVGRLLHEILTAE